MKLRTFKTSDEEWQKWAVRARRQNQSLSAWIRRVMNERESLEAALEKEHEMVDGYTAPLPPPNDDPPR